MKPTLLAIDDEPIILEMYQATLNESYNLHTVSSGREALEFLAVHAQIDLILLDIMMAEMDGFEVCRAIRENPLWAHVKIILVSVKLQLEDRLRGYAEGADDYITKPFDENELLAKVSVFLRLKNVEEIDKIKSNAMRLLSNDARAPLNVILGCAGALRDRPSLLPEDKYLVDQIIKYGRSISRSSEKTILLSDLKSGKIRPYKEKIPLDLFLTEAQLKFTKQAASKSLTIQVRRETDRYVEADRKLLQLALDALVDVAIKFAYAGTVVEARAEDAQERIRIEIAIEGKPIPLDCLESIIDEGSGCDEIKKNNHQEDGLNLALARQIAEAHEGSLSAKNHNKGPVFIITLRHNKMPQINRSSIPPYAGSRNQE